jgi:phenylalanyl-tRNA synthetase beta chain
MNLSHAWLKALVPHGKGAHEVADLLTAHVATVEGVARTRADLESFVVGMVMETEKIPDTKLSFNKVDDGSGTLLEVVCGAPNVVVGTKYPFARTGTLMPAGITIEKRKIRGFTSNGMLCSARELGLGDDHDGILRLATDAPPGTPLLDVLPISDVRIELDVLPNRPDLLGHVGVARELAAITGVALQHPPELASLPVSPAVTPAAPGVSITVENAADCPRYLGAIIRGVTVGPSPAWLKERLAAIGARSINNVVDATNYLLHGFGQPVHAFDLKTLAGPAIVVRRATEGESLVTLDGTTRKLTAAMLVIADAAHAQAVAGVMGGRASEVTEQTTDILLEVAVFDPRLVRSARRALALPTDASYRFERGVDAAALDEVARIGAALIVSVAGGSVEAVVGVGDVPKPRAAVSMRAERVARLLGDAVSEEEIGRHLTSVGFTVAAGSDRALAVTPPSWRHDVTRDVDLVEEIARLRGYDRLPDALAGARPGNVPDHPLHLMSERVRDALVAAGLFEVKPLPYTKDHGRPMVRVENPIAQDEPFLRDAILITLAERAEYNLSRMQGNLRLFEVGTAFLAASAVGDGVREEMRVGALVMGQRRPVHFTEPQPPRYDAWDAKALAERIAVAAWPGARITLDAGAGGDLWSVQADGRSVGRVVSVALDAPAWAAPAFGVEITLGEMSAAYVAEQGRHAYGVPSSEDGQRTTVNGPPSTSVAPVRYHAIPNTPATDFDLALLVPNDRPAADVEAVIRTTSGTMLEDLVLFDEFRGTGVPDGHRSLAWRLTFRHPERTLRDKEIDGRRAQLLKALKEELGVVPRTA